jgi:NADH-quinone oxidoreductase subunit D
VQLHGGQPEPAVQRPGGHVDELHPAVGHHDELPVEHPAGHQQVLGALGVAPRPHRPADDHPAPGQRGQAHDRDGDGGPGGGHRGQHGEAGQQQGAGADREQPAQRRQLRRHADPGLTGRVEGFGHGIDATGRSLAVPRKPGRLGPREGLVSSGAPTERIVGLGAGAELVGGDDRLATQDMVLNIGPQHPSTHGVLRLRLLLDGERIITAEPIVGYMHRGAEKLFEVRDYRQIIVLANRHDWLSAFANELGVVLAAERMLGMEVPERAVWTRTLLAELNRVLNHLMFLGSYPIELGAITPIFYAFRERETIQAVMEEVSGGRMHYMFNRVGGLKEELPAGWTGRARHAVDEVRRRLPDIENLVLGNEIFHARTRGVGVLSPELVHAYGVSGPIARASGVDLDLRRDEPYLAYGSLDVPVVTRTAGDCLARFQCLFEQVQVSLDLADACLERLQSLPPGPVSTRLPKVLKVPEGSTYAWTENPLGINGYYLVSRGEKTPWRLKLRSASFNNIQVLSELLPGTLVSDMVAILGSMFFVVGDIDK